MKLKAKLPVSVFPQGRIQSMTQLWFGEARCILGWQ